jgi:TPR repeat protein
LKWFRKAAEQGQEVAQNNLGVMYEHAEGVPKNETEALQWYRKAAEQGYAPAQWWLGTMYNNGHGVAKNYTEGMRWVRRAADQGFVNAQVTLSVLYEKGNGGAPQDYVLAYMWANLAAAQGIMLGEDAAKDRDRIAKLMTAAQIAEAQKLTREWKPKPER